MTDFANLEQTFEQYDRGEARLTAIRKAIHEADLEQSINWQFWFRYDYLEESIFCGDRYFALIIFPELLAIYDEHTELQESESHTHSLLIAFKWIVEAAPEFPQISREEIDGYFREFKKRLRREEKSLSIYYMKRCLFYMHVDKDIAGMCFYRFLDEPLDDISDGRALYYDQQVEYYLSVGDEEKALQALQPLAEGQYHFSHFPQVTYNEFVSYYMRTGQLDKARYYADQIESRVTGDPYYHHIMGTLMTLYAKTDPPRACRMFSHNYADYLESKNPWLRMFFAIGASHLFDRLRQEPELFAKEIRLPAVKRGVDLQTLSAELHASASALTNQFDTRNGTDDYTQMYLHPFGKE